MLKYLLIPLSCFKKGKTKALTLPSATSVSWISVAINHLPECDEYTSYSCLPLAFPFSFN